MRRFLFLLALLPLTLAAGAQNKTKAPDYSKKPYWIDMIKDPNVNYFEAVKAYDTFWKGKEKPAEEDQLIGQEKEAKSKKKKREEMEEKELYRKYALECKKFEHWKRTVKPYVQADGHILTQEEQLKIWEEQKNKRK